MLLFSLIFKFFINLTFAEKSAVVTQIRALRMMVKKDGERSVTREKSGASARLKPFGGASFMCGNNGCSWIIIIILILLCCGGCGFGGGGNDCGCNNGCGGCGC